MDMPTKLRRHTITETYEVARALSQVRAVGETLDLKRLVILGAERLVEEHHSQEADEGRRAALRQRLLTRTLTAPGVDAEATQWAHEQAWQRNLLDD
jgi:hypothetical protein